jgi:tetratricopeptide (TPR) repeat protein
MKEQNESMPSKPVMNESSGYYWKVRGNESYQKGRYEEAIEFYTKAIVMLALGRNSTILKASTFQIGRRHTRNSGIFSSA